MIQDRITVEVRSQNKTRPETINITLKAIQRGSQEEKMKKITTER
jgi:hypothetical protein